MWHTFWTAGVCPGCRWRWEQTQCPSCGEIAPHKSWYREPEDRPAERDPEQERLPG